jgi:phospholipid transport system substrate-binding protein
MKSVFALVLTLFTLLAGSPDALAADGPGTETVRRANSTLVELLKQKAAPGSAEERRLAGAVRAKLKTFLDVDELGRRALVDHWASLDAAQRSEFTSTLRELVEASYLKALRNQVQYRVRYVSEQSKGADLVVATEVDVEQKQDQQALSIDYVLRRDGDSWRAFDVVTDGVGLVENYRAQFNKIIAKEGVVGLLTRMKKKLAS